MSVWMWTQTVLSVRSIRRICLCKGKEKLSGFSFGFFCCSVGWLLLFGFFPPGQWLPPDSQHSNRYLINHWPNSNNDSTFGGAPSGVAYSVLSGTGWCCRAHTRNARLPWAPFLKTPLRQSLPPPSTLDPQLRGMAHCTASASPLRMFI